MTATDFAAREASARPLTVRALEPRVSVTLSDREPAARTVRPTLPVLPAAMFAGLAKASLALAPAAATDRSSWKAAAVITVLATARSAVAPTRTLPRARAEATVARARS